MSSISINIALVHKMMKSISVASGLQSKQQMNIEMESNIFKSTEEIMKMLSPIQKLSTKKYIPTIRNQVKIPIMNGKFIASFISFHHLSDRKEHLAIGLGNWQNNPTPLIRIHSECMTGDLFGSTRCDCGHQLEEAVSRIEKEGGFLLYLRQEGRGIGLYNKLDAYKLQDAGYDTFEANQKLNFADDLRDYRCAQEMLQALNIREIKLLTNNPQKLNAMQHAGIEVKQTLRTGVFVNDDNFFYLLSKQQKTSHTFSL